MATRAESAASPNEEAIRRLLLPCVLASSEDPLLDPPTHPLLVRGYGAASIVCYRQERLRPHSLGGPRRQSTELLLLANYLVKYCSMVRTSKLNSYCQLILLAMNHG